MRTAVIILSNKGYETACNISANLESAHIYIPRKLDNSTLPANRYPLPAKTFYDFPLSDLVSRIFNNYDALIFIMALGIVVREISPFISDKESDPAIITIDESGRFCVSTIGGHEAGANNLAKKISAIINAQPVITTASESSMVVMGIGLRKNKTKQEIKNAIQNALKKKNLELAKIKKILSVDIKENDKSLKEACEDLSLPLSFVSKEQIETLGLDFEGSDFVKDSIGIKAVCEPAALIGSENKQLIMPKTVYDGITIAIAR